MTKKYSRYKTARRCLIFWTLFIGIGAVAGASGMILDPSGKAMGMDAMLPYFQKLPFADLLFVDLLFSGFALLIVNGITNLAAAALLFRKARLGALLGGSFGVTLMLWICIQLYMFPPNFMSTIYFVFGFCQAVSGFSAYIFQKQESFSIDAGAYTNIGSDRSKLVVYFSRMGYVKKVAYEVAERSGADIFEIKASERTGGTLGFWWCGRYAMHRWDMPIEPIKADLAAYDEVTICSPIWVFSLASPMRSFLRCSAGKIRAVKYIFVHHTKGSYLGAAREADAILGIEHSALTNVISRVGKLKEYTPRHTS